MLSIGKRTTSDPRTLGTLFFAGCDEIQQTSFCEALAILLNLFEQTLKTVGLSTEQVLNRVAEFIDQLPPVFKERLLLLLPKRGKPLVDLDVYSDITMCES